MITIILAASKIGFFGGLLLKLGLPALIGAIFAYVPLMNVINALHKCLDSLIEHNADGRITQEEYNEDCDNARELMKSLGGLWNGIMLLLNKGAKIIILIFCLAALSGCATSNMSCQRTWPDGSKTNYTVSLSSLMQDFKGSDLAASMNPEGKTTVKAGAIDNTTNAMAADALKQMVDLFKTMLPYIAKGAAGVPAPTP